jgi:hypothetical protein
MLKNYVKRMKLHQKTYWNAAKNHLSGFGSTIAVFLIVFIFAMLRCKIAFNLGQYGVTTDMNFIEARNVLGGLDAGSYLQGALSIYQGSFREGVNDFIWQLWPPGVPIVGFLAIKIFGTNSNPLQISAVLSSVLLATWVAGLWYFSIKSKIKIMVRLLLAFLLISSVIQGWILDQGIMYAEGFYIFFTVFALILIAHNSFLNTKVLVSAGILLGLAAYFRAIGFTVIVFLIILSGITWMVAVSGGMLKSKKIETRKLFENSKAAGIVSLSAYLTTLPWSLFRESWLAIKPTKWVVTGDRVWQGVWSNDKQLNDSGWAITIGTDNWACHLDKIKCQVLQNGNHSENYYFLETMKTVIMHPIEFVSMRVNDLWNYWELNGRWLYPPQNKIPAAYGTIEGSIFLVIVGVAVFLLLQGFKKLTVLVLVEIAVILGSTAPLIVFHLESRYFIPIKIVTVVIVILNSTKLLEVSQTKKIAMKK